MSTPKHITIVTSPSGEEWYEAYGPLTKDRGEATEYFTNPQTLRAPERFGRNGTAFWQSEIRAESAALKEYAGWNYRHEPIEAETLEAALCSAD